MTQEWAAAEGISRTNGVTWDILICSIEHRTGMLTLLLEELGRQCWQLRMRAGVEKGLLSSLTAPVGVRVFRDNLQTEYGAKCQRLLDSSSAEYISFLDDDDWVEPDFIATIYEALVTNRPDYVGFKVRYTENGNPQVPVFHTLACEGWHNAPDALYRDIVHFNPIRRDLAVQGVWEGGDGADRRWADQLRERGCVKTEVFIDREMHHYRHRMSDTFTASSSQAPLETPVPKPDFPWVHWID